MHAVDTVLLDGRSGTMDERRTVIADGALALSDGAIVAVGPRDTIVTAYRRPAVS
jgi:predicted amidohydrolase YtcJ